MNSTVEFVELTIEYEYQVTMMDDVVRMEVPYLTVDIEGDPPDNLASELAKIMKGLGQPSSHFRLVSVKYRPKFPSRYTYECTMK